jgi:hypothetical protein
LKELANMMGPLVIGELSHLYRIDKHWKNPSEQSRFPQRDGVLAIEKRSSGRVVSYTETAAGIPFRWGVMCNLVAVAPANLPRLNEIHVSWPVLLFAFGLSLLTAITFGVFPSLRSLRADP